MLLKLVSFLHEHSVITTGTSKCDQKERKKRKWNWPLSCSSMFLRLTYWIGYFSWERLPRWPLFFHRGAMSHTELLGLRLLCLVRPEMSHCPAECNHIRNTKEKDPPLIVHLFFSVISQLLCTFVFQKCKWNNVMLLLFLLGVATIKV